MKAFVSVYFMVQGTEDEECANMAVHLSGTKDSNVRIPLLRNTCALKANDELKVHKLKTTAKVEPLEESPVTKKRKTSKK